VEKSFEKHSRTKTMLVNVGKIDTWAQFLRKGFMHADPNSFFLYVINVQAYWLTGITEVLRRTAAKES